MVDIRKLKTTFVTLICITTGMASAFSQGGSISHCWESDTLNLKGKVKSIEFQYYYAVDKLGEITKGEVNFESSFMKFDNNGNVTEWAGRCEHYWFATYKYNNTGKPIEIIEYNPEGEISINSIDYSKLGLSAKYIYKYDEKGNLAEEKRYGYDSLLIYKGIYKYDEKDSKIEENHYYYHSDGKLDRKYIYKYDNKGNKIEESYSDGWLDPQRIDKYDDKGNVIETISCDSYNNCSKSVSKYNDKGKIIERNNYKSDGGLDYKHIFKYDIKGNNVEENYYNSDGKLYSQVTYKYDEKGNEIEYALWKDCYKCPNGSMNYNRKYVYKYDDGGNMIEKSEYKSDGNLQPLKGYKYDDRGNKIEEHNYYYTSDGSSNGKNIYIYDDRGNQIGKIRYEPDGRINDKQSYGYKSWNEYKSVVYEYEYKYDSKGNWIEEITYKGEAKIPQTIDVRIIEYY